MQKDLSEGVKSVTMLKNTSETQERN